MKRKQAAKGKARTRRFAEGDEVVFSRRAKSYIPENFKKYMDTEVPAITGKTEVSSTETPTTKKQSFKEAFAAARKAGDSDFSWGGKKFTTKLAEEVSEPSVRRTATQAASVNKDKTTAKTAPQVQAPRTVSGKIQAQIQQMDADRAAAAAKRGEPVRKSIVDVLPLRVGQRKILQEQAEDAKSTEKNLDYYKQQEAKGRKALAEAVKTGRNVPYGFQHLLGLDPESVAVRQINNAVAQQKDRQRQLANMEKGDFYAKGGKVKAKKTVKKPVKKHAKGGSIPSASKRADGCAIRGKTRAR